MTLSEKILQYRQRNQLSQRQFALKCGVSNANISMLEKNLNPKTDLPLVPTLPMLKKIAEGMGLTLDELFAQVDDFPVDLSLSAKSHINPFSDETIEIARMIELLDELDRAEIRGEVRAMLRAEKYKKAAQLDA